MHFAAFELRSDASMPPAESETASWINVGALEQTPRPSRSAEQGTPDFPQVHQLTPNADQLPDPWMGGQDPWSVGLSDLLRTDPVMQWFTGSNSGPPTVQQSGQPQANLMHMARNMNTWNLPFDSTSRTRALQPEQVQLPILPQVTAMQQVVARSAEAAPMDVNESVQANRSVPLFYSSTGQISSTLPMQPSRTEEPAAGSAASQVVSMFAEVHAARSRTSSQSEPRNAREAASSSRHAASREVVPQETEVRPYARPFSNQRTICQQVFNQGEEILRIECGHMFHSLCFSEMLQHTESEGSPSLCPNCRSSATVISTWVYAIPLAQSEVPTELPSTPSQAARAVLALPDRDPMSPLNAAINTPVPSEHDGEFADTEEFCTPEQAFAWWPVPDVNAGPNAQDSFHAATLDEGWGLLVDPGSYGNLVGDKWLEEMYPTLYKYGKEIARCKRDAPMHVGGVGKGSQHCVANCMFPLALQRTDGSMHLGDFTSPIVSNSRTPALLGLRSLMRHRAVLDLGKKMLHLVPDNTEVELTLPDGSESYELKQAQSGHLLLPFTDFPKLQKVLLQNPNTKMIHLFTDKEDQFPGQAEPSSGSGSQTTVRPPDRTALDDFMPPDRDMQGPSQEARIRAGVEEGPLPKPRKTLDIVVEAKAKEGEPRQFKLTPAAKTTPAKHKANLPKPKGADPKPKGPPAKASTRTVTLREEAVYEEVPIPLQGLETAPKVPSKASASTVPKSSAEAIPKMPRQPPMPPPPPPRRRQAEESTPEEESRATRPRTKPRE